MTVRLHIERLVIDGFEVTGSEAAGVRAALEAELTERHRAHCREEWRDEQTCSPAKAIRRPPGQRRLEPHDRSRPDAPSPFR